MGLGQPNPNTEGIDSIKDLIYLFKAIHSKTLSVFAMPR